MLPPTLGFRARLVAPGRGDTGASGTPRRWQGRCSDAPIPRRVPEAHQVPPEPPGEVAHPHPGLAGGCPCSRTCGVGFPCARLKREAGLGPGPLRRSPQLDVAPAAPPSCPMGKDGAQAAAGAGGKRGIAQGPAADADLPRGWHPPRQGAMGRQRGKRRAKAALIISAPCLSSLSKMVEMGITRKKKKSKKNTRKI